MVDEALKHHVRAIVAVGTAGLRTASNRDEVVVAIDEATGVTVNPISGEEESRLAYLAVRAELGLTDGALVVFDTGGGSTQFTFGHDSEVDDRFSIDVGAVRYTERFGLAAAVSADALQAALAAIASDLHRLDGRPAPDALVGMGGAVTNITAVKLGLDPYDPDAVQGAILERADIDRQIELYRSRDADGRRSIVGLQPKRADVILAGACIVRTVMDKLGQDTVTVSDRGLRHGLLIVERRGSGRKHAVLDAHMRNAIGDSVAAPVPTPHRAGVEAERSKVGGLTPRQRLERVADRDVGQQRREAGDVLVVQLEDRALQPAVAERDPRSDVADVVGRPAGVDRLLEHRDAGLADRRRPNNSGEFVVHASTGPASSWAMLYWLANVAAST